MAVVLRQTSKIVQFLKTFLGLESSQPQLFFLPGEAFFSQAIDLPSKLSPKELESFLLLSLEESSPFPIEQLYWGYWSFDKKALVFAIPQKRLFEIVDPKALSNGHVFPSFFLPIENEKSHQAIQFIRFSKSLSILLFKPQSKLPEKILTISLEDDVDEQTLEDAHRKALSHFDLEKVFWEKGFWEISGFHQEKKQAVFTLVHQNLASKIETSSVKKINQSRLWEADIRPKAALISEKKRGQLDRVLNRALLGAGIFILFLLAGELVGFSLKTWLGYKKSVVLEQTPIVKKIEAEDALIGRIDSIVSETFRPFNLLEQLNLSRPKTLYFTAATLESDKNIDIRGMAQNINEVNNYRRSLLREKQFASVELDRVESKQGKVTFTLKCKAK